MLGRTKHTIIITTFKRVLKRENHEQYLLFTKEQSVYRVWFKDESFGHWIARLHRYKLKYPPVEPVKPMVPTLKLEYSHGSWGVPPKYRLFEYEPYEDFPRVPLKNCTGLYGVPIVGFSNDYLSSGIRLQNVF